MVWIVYLIVLLNYFVLIEGNGEKYDLETYNLMQILRPVGSSMVNGTNTGSPVTYNGHIFVSKKLYPGLFFQHFHIPKTGGTTFKDLVVVSNPQGIDLIKNCGFTYVGHKKSGEATKYARNTEDVMKSGCSYYSHEFSASDCMFYLDSSEYAIPYKFIRTMNMVRRPLDHAFSALGHYARYHQKGMKERCSGLHEYLGGKCSMYDLHNMQTTRLAYGNLTKAIDILDKMFWVGITEYFDASICLLAYQLGQFNSKLCDCNQKPKNVADHKNVQTNAVKPTQTDILKLNAMLTVDNLLYAHALSIFFKRMDNVERVLGLRLICDDVNHKSALTKFDYTGATHNLMLNKEHL